MKISDFDGSFPFNGELVNRLEIIAAAFPLISRGFETFPSIRGSAWHPRCKPQRTEFDTFNSFLGGVQVTGRALMQNNNELALNPRSMFWFRSEAAQANWCLMTGERYKILAPPRKSHWLPMPPGGTTRMSAAASAKLTWSDKASSRMKPPASMRKTSKDHQRAQSARCMSALCRLYWKRHWIILFWTVKLTLPEQEAEVNVKFHTGADLNVQPWRATKNNQSII